MADIRLRRNVALLAARLMYDRSESEYFTAKRKAAKQLGLDARHKPNNLPSNAEIREQVQLLACAYEGESRRDRLRDMRLDALRLMRKLDAFRPRLIGSTLTGHVRHGSDVDLHVFADTVSAITAVLDGEGLRYDVERKRVVKHGEARTFTHVHASDRFEFELTVYGSDQASYVFKSSITGRGIERASIPELEQFLRREYPGIDLDAETQRLSDHADRFELYAMLLRPLADVKQNARWHPEGDALYHSLQVFDLARDCRGYDEEFLLAALLHDVGKAIDPADHAAASVAALEGAVTDRTAWLVTHHMDAQSLSDGTLGHRAATRLRESGDFDDLMLLRDLDRAGRHVGVEVPEVDEAIAVVRALDAED